MKTDLFVRVNKYTEHQSIRSPELQTLCAGTFSHRGFPRSPITFGHFRNIINHR
ncbi:MAG: hypothetical protein ABSF10_15420 [Verrucomicrobiota bacterium]